METTPSSSLTRYRPVVLAITGFAALYGAYIVYKNIHKTPSSSPSAPGVHRSNAVHRPRRPARQPRQNTQDEEASDGNNAQQALQMYEYWATLTYGTVPLVDGAGQTHVFELRADRLPSLETLRQEYDLSEEVARQTLTRLHRDFAARFMTVQFSAGGRAGEPAQQELLAATEWLESLGITATDIGAGLEQMIQAVVAVQRGNHNDGDDDAHTVAGTDIGVQASTSRFGQRNTGLNLKQLLYHIAETQARSDGFLHRGFRCDSCGTSPIRGTRWKCANCIDLDLCNECHATCMHARNHIFYEIKIPTYTMNNIQPVTELAYPGRVDLSKSPNLPADLCRELVEKSGMEKSEIEGLYEQFACLASTPRKNDPVEYAIDRATFPHIISPLSPYAPLRMNLVFDRLFAMFDTNHDDLIDFEEFIGGVNFLRGKLGQKMRWKKTFEAYDVDGDGVITRSDCLRMFRALYSIQHDLALDLITKNESVNALRDATSFAQGGRVISAAFSQNPRTVPDPRHMPKKTPNEYGDKRHQPGQEVIKENGYVEGNPEEIIGNSWESQAQFPFDQRTGQPLSLRDFLYLAPRDQSGQAPTHIARDQKVQFAYDGKPVSEARKQAVEERQQRIRFYNTAEDEVPTINGYEIPGPPKDFTRDVAYAVLEESLNELLDPMFKPLEDFHIEAQRAKKEISHCEPEITKYIRQQREKQQNAERAANDPLMSTAAAAEQATRHEEEERNRQQTPRIQRSGEINGHLQPPVPPFAATMTGVIEAVDGERTAIGQARPPVPSVAEVMNDLINDLEEDVAARPLPDLLDSQGFDVHSHMIADAGASGRSRSHDHGTATHLDISASPQPSPLEENRSMRLVPPTAITGMVPISTSATPALLAAIGAENDPTMPQFKPNSEKDIIDAAPRTVTLDPLRKPEPAAEKGDDKRPKFEAEIIRQFEYMFLGWERDPTTGDVINAANASTRSAQDDEKPGEERIAQLAEFKEYLESHPPPRDVPGLTYPEFEHFLEVQGHARDMKFLEGWLEVCYF